MRSQFWISVVVVGSTLFCTPVATGQDWDPITEMEKSLNTNPIDPGGGAIVLFKRGNIKLGTEKVFAATRVTTYTRIKILNEAGRKFANISIESSKYDRLSKIEGRTVLPSGEIIRLDPSQIFKGKEYEFGSGLSIFKTSFALPSAEPGAIVEYRTVQNSSWYSVPPWVFDTQGLATLRSTLTILIGRVLSIAQFPLETTQTKIKGRENKTVRGWEYHYEVENIPPVREEPYAVPFLDQAVVLIFKLAQFTATGGARPTEWEDVADRFKDIYNDSRKKDKKAKKKAKELTAGIREDVKKAEAIYQYVQKNISSTGRRGVGYGQTVDDIFVSRRGDPDELNVLFSAMLKEAKVKSDLILVPSRNWQTLVPIFPNVSQFLE